MSHPLVLALFRDSSLAADAARMVRDFGVERGDVSIVARSHEVEGKIAERGGATPGVEIEDSMLAAVLGDLSGHVLAAIATVMPGVGPIVAGGPLAAGLGEAAGHLAGGLRSMLHRLGLSSEDAERWERAVEGGAVLLGVHVRRGDATAVHAVLERAQATEALTVSWKEE